MNIRPLYDRLVVKRVENDDNVINGIIIPDSAKEKSQQGEVVAVGKGRRLDDGKLVELDVKVGDTVLFGKYSGSELPGLSDHIIIREDEILGIVENAGKK
jgi:chaperonin GroES